jgi:hypothetical protein
MSFRLGLSCQFEALLARGRSPCRRVGARNLVVLPW